MVSRTNPDGKLIEMHGNVLETVCEWEDQPHELVDLLV